MDSKNIKIPNHNNMKAIHISSCDSELGNIFFDIEDIISPCESNITSLISFQGRNLFNDHNMNHVNIKII